MEKTKSEWNELKTVKTPKFRASFPHVFKPHAFEKDGKAKYSIVMLFDKSISLKDLQTAANAAAVEKWGADKNKWPKGLRSPFRDGDEKNDLQGYVGTTFVSASSDQKPGLIDINKNDIVSEEDFYAGCYARAQIRAFAYDQKGNRGVSFALHNVQKLSEGEAFSGRKPATTVFDDDFQVDDNGLAVEENDMGF